MTKTIKMTEKYLKEPYSRVLIPDDESGTYTAVILEFPGCIAQGDTPQEAYEHLEDAAKDWIAAALDLKQEIPSPSQSLSFGGKILLRLPKSLHRRLTLIAETEGVSLNQFIVSALAEKVGAFTLYDKLTKKMDHIMFQLSINTAVSTIVTDTTTRASSGDRLIQPIRMDRLDITEVKSNA
ncbi:MAG: type II toxin-antitoxin system HicB family antitoxin [Desulfobacterales bacterium]|nr:type II toxin-antitoxin system HicB family antitoxin [Pseudomonadota bacterium]MBU4356317.1 type II toxin-antitoxin system HicB family antitoxin [Pseudomonadota bacterium]MCG2773431.1 type II toxin-antitoxin system HicB family antitoxin [Desulfobacterales bacterium]